MLDLKSFLSPSVRQKFFCLSIELNSQISQVFDISTTQHSVNRVHCSIDRKIKHGWQLTLILVCHLSPHCEQIHESKAVENKECTLALRVQIAEGLEICSSGSDSQVGARHINVLIHVKV